MLAAKAGALTLLKYPVMATPKIDGIRCMTLDVSYDGRLIESAALKCLAVSRRLKAIPNEYIRAQLESQLLPGFDGELETGTFVNGLWVRDPFNEISSKIMSQDGFPEFRYVVFDYGHNHTIAPPFPQVMYWKRVRMLSEINMPSFCVRLLPILIKTAADLIAYEAACLQEGYEGVMIRTPESPYKLGRSTLKEQYLIKIKRFLDSEAEVTGTYEKMHNNNPAERSATGSTERSTHQENMVPCGTLGGIEVQDLVSGKKFNIGTGFNDQQRADLWGRRDSLVGMICKYRHQPHGAHEKPRFPVFLGWRHEADMPAPSDHEN